MMVVCIELRIPLFVIGKPGSSKSLAKTVVADNMQGDASKSPLFKKFKRVSLKLVLVLPHFDYCWSCGFLATLNCTPVWELIILVL